MNKIHILTTSIVTLAVIFSSFLFVSNNKVNAQVANACIDFSDDFTSDSGKWISIFGTNSIENGELKVESENLTNTFAKGEVAFRYFSEEYSPLALEDWTITFDITNLELYTTDDSTMTSAGGFLYNEAPVYQDITGYYSQILDYDGGTVEYLRAQLSENTSVNTDPYIDITNDFSINNPINIKFVKTDITNLEILYKFANEADSEYKVLRSFANISPETEFRLDVWPQTSDQGNAALFIDNFVLDCGGATTPEPVEPIDTTTPFDVQRFFNIRIGSAHFYSIDPVEAKFVEDNSKAGGLWPGAFVKEAPTFAAFNYDSVNDKCMDGTSPVYRYLNRTTGDTHFYAIKADEISAVEGQFASTFKPEGVSFCAYLNEATGSVPVYRWQNKILGSTHFYSASPTEVNVVNNDLSSTFSPEGIAFYGMPVDNVDYSVVDNTPTPDPVIVTGSYKSPNTNFGLEYDPDYFTMLTEYSSTMPTTCGVTTETNYLEQAQYIVTSTLNSKGVNSTLTAGQMCIERFNQDTLDSLQDGSTVLETRDIEINGEMKTLEVTYFPDSTSLANARFLKVREYEFYPNGNAVTYYITGTIDITDVDYDEFLAKFIEVAETVQFSEYVYAQ